MEHVGVFNQTYRSTGYGPQPFIVVETLPNFVNHGYNEFHDEKFTRLSVVNLREADVQSSYPRGGDEQPLYAESFWGWAWLITKDGTDECPVYLTPVDWDDSRKLYTGELYTVKG